MSAPMLLLYDKEKIVARPYLSLQNDSKLADIFAVLLRLIGSVCSLQTTLSMCFLNSAVHHAIGALYSDLIDFSSRVVQSPFGPRFAPWSLPSDKDFCDVSEHINFQNAEIDGVANAANSEET